MPYPMPCRSYSMLETYARVTHHFLTYFGGYRDRNVFAGSPHHFIPIRNVIDNVFRLNPDPHFTRKHLITLCVYTKVESCVAVHRSETTNYCQFSVFYSESD